MIGDQCFKVDGALSVPFGKEYPVKKLFFFCPKRLCVTRPPMLSNILIMHPLAIIKGYNISDEGHECLMVEMKNSYYLVDSDLISTCISDLLLLLIFTFLCCYYDCTRNILLL